MEPVMPFCVDFFKTTVDALVALVSAAMTLVASLVHPTPGQPQSVSSSPAIALISYVAGQDTADLAARLRDADPRTRTIAACDLQRMGSQCAQARSRHSSSDCRMPHRSIRRSAARIVTTGGRTSTIRPRPGRKAAAALVAIGTESLPSLITASRAPQWVARRNAVWALGALDDARGVAPALAAMADREPPVRRVAAWALGALDADVAVTALD